MDFIDSMDKNKEETWAKKLFKNEGSPKKVKIEVQGSVKTENLEKKGWFCAPVEFFINNTDVETTEEDVKEAAKEFGNIELLELERKTKIGATYGSFRIKVDRKDSDRCLNDDSWPQGWKIRRFYRNYKVSKIDIKTKLKKKIEELKGAKEEDKLRSQRDKLIAKTNEEKEKMRKAEEEKAREAALAEEEKAREAALEKERIAMKDRFEIKENRR